METNLLKYFLKVTEVGNITRAAQQLHLTQPTLSRQLIELEKELGVKLLNREKRQLSLTPAGIKFSRHAQIILRELSATKKDMQQSEVALSGKLKIGCVESSISKYLASWLAEFQKKNPAVSFSIFDGNGSTIKEQIDRNELELGFVMDPIEAAKYNAIAIPLSETWGVLMSKTSHLADKKEITGPDLLGLPLLQPRRDIVKSEIEDWLKFEPSELDFVGDVDLINNAIPLIANEGYYQIGISSALELTNHTTIVFRPLHPKNQTKNQLIWRKTGGSQSAAAIAFLAFVQKKIQELS